MSMRGSDEHVRNRTVPEIRVDGQYDLRGSNTRQRHWDTAYEWSSSTEPLADTGYTEDLEEQLLQKAVRHANGSSFWPPGALNTTVTKRAITKEILRVFPTYTQEHAEGIADQIRQGNSGQCVQVFTILVLLDQVELLVEHILDCPQGVRDHDLPLKFITRKGSGKGILCRADSEKLCCFSRWRTVHHESFERFQRRLAVPVFMLERHDKTLIHLDLDANDILPWREEAEVPPISAMSGGAGTVIRVQIDPRCHEFHETLKAVCTVYLFVCPRLIATSQINVAQGIFAVKRLRKKTVDEFRHEVDALRRFSGKVHPHLITLLATFTQGGYYHMIFPWAECDLEWYWDNINPTPDPNDVGLVRWLSRQCLGIMEAVSVIHNPSHLTSEKKFGRHGDIKAENILWFKTRPKDPGDRGMLVISDLGLAAINSDKSRSMQPNTGLKMTPSYRPPECDARGGTISRAFDIWTLGCLYLELVCWLLRGKIGKDKFDEARTTPFIFGSRTNVYFEIEERKRSAPQTYVFKVKDVVSKVSSTSVLSLAVFLTHSLQTLSQLHEDSYCSQWIHGLLDLVQKDMLVVLSNQRKTSQALLETLRKLDARVQTDVWYGTRPAPQKRKWERDVGAIAELNEAAKKHVDDNGVRTHESDQDRQLQRWDGLAWES